MTDDVSDDRVLLLVAGDRDRELLAERLGERHDVAAADPDGEWGRVDLCVVDAANYPEARDRLTRRREDTVAYLPVLLLVPDRGDAGEAEWVAEALDGPVDEVLVVPASRAEFTARAEALLRIRRQSAELALFRRAMDEASVGISISDPSREDNPLIYVNEGFVEMTGYDYDDVIGRNCRFLRGPETDEAVTTEVREAIEAERTVTVELLNYTAAGEPFWNRLTVAPVHDRRGELTNFVGLHRDITERIERSRALKRYETVVETATDPILVLDPEGRIEQVNDATETATGSDAAELVGTHVSTLTGEADADRVERSVAEVLSGRRDQTGFEASLVAADGTSREYLLSGSAIHGSDGVDGATLVGHEVTDLRKHQRRLSVLDRVLRHNLRNKLNVVVARAEQIEAEARDGQTTDAAAAIRRASEDLLSVGEAVRQFQGVVDPSGTTQTPVEIVRVVERAAEGVRETYPGVVVETDCPASATAAGDETLSLAVEELIENAAAHGTATAASAAGVEATDGEAVVSVSVDDRPAEGLVAVSVTDGGPGLSAAGRQALEHGTETPLEHTDGLGLWLVRWAVDNAGGEIRIAENEPHGTIVTLRLPRAEDRGDGAETQPA